MSPAIVALSWTTIAWSACAASCVTLSIVYLYLGVRQRSAPNLAFALAAASAATMAAFELALQRSQTPAEYGRILQGTHVALFFLIGSTVLFVRSYLHAGRVWLAWTIVVLRALTLLVNFLHPPNFNFDRIDSLHRIPLWGDAAVIPVGVVSPWTRLGQLISALLFAFVADAAVTVWRRGERRKAALIGGSMLLFVAVGTVHTAMVHAGLIRSPYVISFAFLPVVAAMWYELTRDILRVPEMARAITAGDEALRERESELSLAAQAARLSVWVWDVRRDELQMPEPARALRGFGLGEWIDIERFLSTVHPDDRDAVERHVRESLERPGPFEREYRIVLPDGRVRWINAIGVVEADSSGTATCVRGVSIDVTERKLAQLESEKHRTELAHLARFTTLGELSGSLAHELNQPLSAILSNAEAAQRFLAQDPPDVGELRAILDDIVAEDARAGEVIVRLRALFKKGEVAFQPTDLSAAALDVLRLVRSELVAHDIAVETDLPAVPAVRADRIQIQQVLLNLVKNASDAMTTVAPASRRLSLSVKGNGDGHVKVAVRDSGTGISEDVLRRMFEPFVTTKPDGMGLGLAVCRTIVEAHHGTLNATNNADRGATFEFTLPAADHR
jgi:two-component system, LuxR family, sensor kinase FixL